MSIIMADRGREIGRDTSRRTGTNRTRKFCPRKFSTFLNETKELIMKSKFLLIAAGTVLCTALFVRPASSHHSFAMYDQEKTVVLTGVVKQFVGQANHAELHFYLLTPDRKGIAKSSDGKYIEWGVEMAGAAAVAQQGITAANFGVGTVFSVKLNPLRDGSNFGSRIGAIAKCPIDPATNKAKLPPPDKNCDSV